MIRCHGQDHSIGKRKQGGKREKEKVSLSPDTHSTAGAGQSGKQKRDRKQSAVPQGTLQKLSLAKKTHK